MTILFAQVKYGSKHTHTHTHIKNYVNFTQRVDMPYIYTVYIAVNYE